MKNTQKIYNNFFFGVYFEFEQVYLLLWGDGVFRRFYLIYYNDFNQIEQQGQRERGRMSVRECWISIEYEWYHSNKPLQFFIVDTRLLLLLLLLSEFDHMKQQILWDGCQAHHSENIWFAFTKAMNIHTLYFTHSVIGTLNQFECRFHSNFGNGWLPHSVCNIYFVSLVSRLHFYIKNKTIEFHHSLTVHVYVYAYRAAQGKILPSTFYLNNSAILDKHLHP